MEPKAAQNKINPNNSNPEEKAPKIKYFSAASAQWLEFLFKQART